MKSFLLSIFPLFAGVVLFSLCENAQGKTTTVDTLEASYFFQKGTRLYEELKFDSAMLAYSNAYKGFEAAGACDRALKSRVMIGFSYLEKTDIHTARKHARRALEEASTCVSNPAASLAEAYALLGGTFKVEMNDSLTETYFLKALEVLSAAGQDSTLLYATIQGYLSDHYNMSSRFAEAVLMGEEAFAKKSHILGDTAYELAQAYRDLGATYQAMGLYQKEKRYFEKGLAILSGSPNGYQIIQADLYAGLGIHYERLGDIKNALECYHRNHETLQQVFQKPHFKISESYALLGKCYLDLGDPENAHPFLKNALLTGKEILGEYHPYIGYCYNALGTYYMAMGNSSQQLAYYKKSYQVLVKSGGMMHHWTLKGRVTLAIAYGNNHIPDSATFHFNESLALLTQILGNAHPEISITCLRMGKYFYEQGDFKAASIALQKGLTSSILLGDYESSYIPQFYYYLAKIKLDEGYPGQALVEVQQALSFFQDLDPCDPYHSIGSDFNGNPYHLRACLSLKGSLHEMMFAQTGEEKELHHALHAYTSAVTSVEKIQERLLPKKSELGLRKISWEDFEGAIRTSLALHEKTGDSPLLNQAFGFMQKSKGYSLVSSLQKDIALQFAELPDSILARDKSLKLEMVFYEEKINKLEKRQQKEREGNLFSYQKTLIELQESYKLFLNDLEQTYPRYFQLRYGKKTLKISDLQASLAAKNELLIEYFMGDKEIFVFGISPDSIRVHQVACDTSLCGAIDSLIDNFGNKDLAESKGKDLELFKIFSEKSFNIYQHLVEPVMPVSSEKVDKLVIIPDGKLGYLPFEALLTEQPKNHMEPAYDLLSYLFIRYDIRYEYSASLLERNQNHPKPAAKGYAGYAPAYDQNFLATAEANVRDAYQLQNGLPQLTYNRYEVENVSQDWEGVSFSGREATETRFKREAKNFKILHLAMHGIIHDENPLYSGLAFSTDSTNDGFLHTHEIYNLKLNADLAVLSACNTGRGAYKKGEGIISLARSFKYAGCPNIAMSLWTVDDQAGQIIIEEMFRNLKAGMEKDRALRKAKLAYLKSSHKVHPFYWAGMVLIGDDAPIIHNPDPFSIKKKYFSWLTTLL